VARRALERGSRWPAMAGHGGGGRQSVRCLVRRGKRWGGDRWRVAGMGWLE
jgi:hypothetical protein